MWSYIVLFGVLVIMVTAMLCIENFKTTEHLQTDTDTIIGGTISSKFVHSDGHSTVVNKLLGDSGKTIILVHNSPFNMDVWEPLYIYIQSITNKGDKIPTVISYDLVGHGTAWVPIPVKYNDNNMANSAWGIEKFADDLYEIYQHYVGSGKVTIAGYGFGGTVAQDFAVKHHDIIDHLYLLQTTNIGAKISTLQTEVDYLVEWIKRNPLATYLTLEYQFVNKHMCLWFDINDPKLCPYPENRQDLTNTVGTVEYLIGYKLYTQANCDTYLQISKILYNFDSRREWQRTDISCPVTYLFGKDDHYTDLQDVKDEMNVLKNVISNINTYIVRGKHAFVLTYPEYIYKLITGEDMSKNPLTTEVI